MIYTTSQAFGGRYSLYDTRSKEHAFENIVFYRDGKIVLNLRVGSFVPAVEGVTKSIPAFTLDNELKRRRSLDLSKGGHFWLPADRQTVYLNRYSCIVYFDLALDDFTLGEEHDAMIFEDFDGKRIVRARPLINLFGGSKPTMVSVAVPGTARIEYSRFGASINEMFRHLATQDRKSDLSPLKEATRDPKLMLLMLRAAQANATFGDNPTVASVLDQMLVVGAMSV